MIAKLLKRFLAFLTGGLVLLTPLGLQAQDYPRTGMIENKVFDKEVHDLLQFSVPTLSVEEAWRDAEQFTFIDTRQREEFEVSRIPDAIYLGYRNPRWSVMESVPRDANLIVYCSVGYRSEKIAEKLREKGFNRVYNLYGSIFEWANRGYPLEDPESKRTNRLHTYNKKWSRFVENPEIEEVW